MQSAFVLFAPLFTVSSAILYFSAARWVFVDLDAQIKTILDHLLPTKKPWNNRRNVRVRLFSSLNFLNLPYLQLDFYLNNQYIITIIHTQNVFFVKYIKMKYIKKTRQKIKEFRMSSYFSPRWSDCPSTAACSARIAPASHSALFLGSQHACSARRSCRGSSRKSTCRPFLALFRNSDLSKICFFSGKSETFLWSFSYAHRARALSFSTVQPCFRSSRSAPTRWRSKTLGKFGRLASLNYCTCFYSRSLLSSSDGVVSSTILSQIFKSSFMLSSRVTVVCRKPRWCFASSMPRISFD